MAYNNQSSDHSQSPQPDSFQSIPQAKGPFNVVLNSEEVRILRECNKESFYYRCVPLTFLFSGITYIGIQKGYLSASGKLGYFPKMLGGAVLGYIVGKFSYQSKCAEKFLHLPNSKLGEALRKRKGIQSFEEGYEMNPNVTDAPINYSQSSGLFDDRSKYDGYEGKDGFEKVTEDLRPYTEGEYMNNKEFGSISYEELRRKNRESASKPSSHIHNQSPATSYYDPVGAGVNRSSSTPYSYPSSENTPSTPTPQTPYFDRRKNKYGDIWDD